MRTGKLACAALLVLTCGACGDDGGAAPDADTRPAWQGGLPDSDVMGERRGLLPARGIIHLHSPYSHDACDGEPRDEATGAVDEDCLADLRAALCTTRMDYAALTDHDASMADEEFETLFSMRGDDELIAGTGGTPIASRIHCDGGHQVLLTVGGENPLMPIMLDRHVDGTVEERHAIYDGDDVAAATAMRDAGATLWIPHAESRTFAELEPLAPSGMEVYQLHANIDPDIREEFLGLDSGGAITAVVEFADTSEGGPEPDLALLSFLSPNQPSLELWDQLLAAGQHVAGSGGTDAHQNALPIMLRDGERGDSYRRMIRWFSNVALVDDPSDIVAIEQALAGGRMFVAFELMGTPVGFDVRAELPAGDPVELGGTVAAAAGATLEVDVPTVHELDPGLPAPDIAARVIRVTSEGASVVAEGAGPLSVPLDTAGAYRVEVTIRPLHLGPYLGNLRDRGYAEQVLPWIYGSPIYVE
jgi:hypothetical protein